MSNDKKPRHPNSLANLIPVKKGQVLNPLGYKSHDLVKKEIKRLTVKTLQDVIEATTIGNLDALTEIIEDPASPTIKVGVAKCIKDAIKRGDWHTIEKIIERIVGKVPEKIEHSGPNGDPIEVSQETPEEKQARKHRIEDLMKKHALLNGS